MTPRDRNLLYGGPVLLVGLVEADGLISMDTNGLSDPYVTIVPLDAEGGEHDKEKNISRTIMETLTPQVRRHRVSACLFLRAMQSQICAPTIRLAAA